MNELFSTIKGSKKITHLHNGFCHAMCGLADDYWEDEEKVIEKPAHKTITCKPCIEQTKRIALLAKKHKIKV